MRLHSIGVDNDFLMAVFGGGGPAELQDPDINVRYDAKSNFLETENPYLPRWRDDKILI